MRHFIAPALILSALAFPVAAQADPISDCSADGSVDGNYSNAQLKKALDNIPGDVDEYSDCRAVIQAAIKSDGSNKKSPQRKRKGATAGASSSGGSSGGSDRAAIAAAGVPVDLNGDGKISGSERTAAKQKQLALKTDNTRRQTERELGAPKTDPTKVGALDAGDTDNGLPLPVLLAIIALALLVVAAGSILVGRRRPAVAQVLRRVPVPKRFRH